MALIICPECGKNVSSRADECPNCGFPIRNLEIKGENSQNIESTSELKTKSNEVLEIQETPMNVESVTSNESTDSDDSKMGQQNMESSFAPSNSDSSGSVVQESKKTQENYQNSSVKENRHKKKKAPIIIVCLLALVVCAIVLLYAFRSNFIQSVELKGTGGSYLALDETIKLSYEISPSFADTGVTWTSSDDSVATVDANGVVKTLSDGECTITATTKNGKTAEYKFTTALLLGDWEFSGVYDVKNDVQYDRSKVENAGLGASFEVNEDRCEFSATELTAEGKWTLEKKEEDSVVYKLRNTDTGDWGMIVTENGTKLVITPLSARDSFWFFFERE